jgi:hypothetical protein
MKKLILPVLVLFFSIGASSCSKCFTCKKGDEWQKICDKDYTNDDVSNHISFMELAGWECKASTGVY